MKMMWMGTALYGALVLAACGGGGEAPKAESRVAGPAAAIDLANGATVTGRVVLDGPAPVRHEVDMSASPVCERAHKSSPALSEEVVVNANGTLKNAFVYINDDGLAGKTWPVTTAPVLLDQVGCVYAPHVIGVMAGQTVEIRNSDPTNHNIHPEPRHNEEWNESQTLGSGERMKMFAHAEVMVPVKCNIHPWMRAWIGVLAHPFFAVTGDDGTFTIKGLPSGTYKLTVWHEKYQTQDVTVTVGPKDSKTVDITFKS